ncbi:MAG: alanine dehydrogenase [Parachlamydiales bacterium]|jgi:alanine dehydrogenase
MSRVIGVPKEIKNHEYRVGMTPAGVRQIVEAGFEVRVETLAGTPIGFTDDMYKDAGAKIVATPQEVYASDIVVKVKEPLEAEFPLLREDQILFCYLHLAPDPEQAKALIASKVTAIAYETVTDNRGRLPLLEPMSEIAGRLSIQVGANYLQLNKGGRGILLGGVPGVSPGKVVIIGGGAAGAEAARMALGLGANVTIIDIDLSRLRHLDALFGPALHTLYSTSTTIEDAVIHADLVVGCVLVPGKKAPKLITRKMISRMHPGSVIVDVAIDQGGCAGTSRPTTHDNPTYLVDGVIHYCVTNMPGSTARTSTMALTNATLQPVLALARLGLEALRKDPHLRNGLNVYKGMVTNESVAIDLNYPYVNPLQAIE